MTQQTGLNLYNVGTNSYELYNGGFGLISMSIFFHWHHQWCPVDILGRISFGGEKNSVVLLFAWSADDGGRGRGRGRGWHDRRCVNIPMGPWLFPVALPPPSPRPQILRNGHWKFGEAKVVHHGPWAYIDTTIHVYACDVHLSIVTIII